MGEDRYGLGGWYQWGSGLEKYKLVGCSCGYEVISHLTETRKRIDAVNVHRAASANTLTATPSEGQCGIHLVLDPDQRIQHHRACLVEVQGVRLHLWLFRWIIWRPSVNVEGLDSGVLVLGWLWCGRCLAFRHKSGAGGHLLPHLGNWFDGGIKPTGHR